MQVGLLQSQALKECPRTSLSEAGGEGNNRGISILEVYIIYVGIRSGELVATSAQCATHWDQSRINWIPNRRQPMTIQPAIVCGNCCPRSSCPEPQVAPGHFTPSRGWPPSILPSESADSAVYTPSKLSGIKFTIQISPVLGTAPLSGQSPITSCARRLSNCRWV